MPKEQDAALAGLRTALQMEIDGKEFYLKVSSASRNELGQLLLKKLAAEEDIHRKVFQGIYDKISKKEGWPDIKYTGDSGKALRTVFKKAMKKLDPSVNFMSAELDAVQTGMDMENKTLDFYRDREDKAQYKAEKALYESLAEQESEHHRILLDYYEFLKDPAQYYVKMEHTSVDGG
jgi:rubrerythrin